MDNFIVVPRCRISRDPIAPAFQTQHRQNSQTRALTAHNPNRKEKTIMVDLLEPRPASPPKRKHPNLILHCGAHRVEFDQVETVKTPRATSTWTPIPHHRL